MICGAEIHVGLGPQSALSFPVGFSSNSKKEAPIGVPGTSKRSVPTLTGEGINTHSLKFVNIIIFFNICHHLLTFVNIREASELKNVTKSGKSPQFS